RMKPGDYLLCYLTGVSRWIGALEVVSEPYVDQRPIWNEAVFPCRVNVKVIVALTPETAIPVHDLRDSLTVFQDLKSPLAWTGHFRGSPARWKAADGEAVVRAILEAQRSPISRPVDARRLYGRRRALGTKIGPLIVPEREEPVADTAASPGMEAVKESTQH